MASPGSVLTIHPGPIWSTYSISTSPAYDGEWRSDVPAVPISPQWDDASSASWAAVVAAFTTGPAPRFPHRHRREPGLGAHGRGHRRHHHRHQPPTVTAVRFGSTTASFTLGSATSMTATAPAGARERLTYGVRTPSARRDQSTVTTPGHHPRGHLVSGPGGSGLTTLAVSPQNLGDVMVLFARGQTQSVSSVTGGGVSTWSKGAQFAASAGQDIEIWYGPVTARAPRTITFTWSGTPVGQDPGVRHPGVQRRAGPVDPLGGSTSGDPQQRLVEHASASRASPPRVPVSCTSASPLRPTQPSSGSTAGFSYG